MRRDFRSAPVADLNEPFTCTVERCFTMLSKILRLQPNCVSLLWFDMPFPINAYYWQAFKNIIEEYSTPERPIGQLIFSEPFAQHRSFSSLVNYERWRMACVLDDAMQTSDAIRFIYGDIQSRISMQTFRKNYTISPEELIFKRTGLVNILLIPSEGVVESLLMRKITVGERHAILSCIPNGLAEFWTTNQTFSCVENVAAYPMLMFNEHFSDPQRLLQLVLGQIANRCDGFLESLDDNPRISLQ